MDLLLLLRVVADAEEPGHDRRVVGDVGVGVGGAVVVHLHVGVGVPLPVGTVLSLDLDTGRVVADDRDAGVIEGPVVLHHGLRIEVDGAAVREVRDRAEGEGVLGGAGVGRAARGDGEGGDRGLADAQLGALDLADVGGDGQLDGIVFDVLDGALTAASSEEKGEEGGGQEKRGAHNGCSRSDPDGPNRLVLKRRAHLRLPIMSWKDSNAE